MLTLKKAKEMVKAPVHTKRVPSPKVLLEDGRILLRKEFEHDSHLTLYHSGYVWFSTPFKFKEHFEATANPKVSMLFSAIILSSTTVIIGCLVVLITESLYNLLYNLPSAPPEMGGLLGQSKNTINTIFVDSGKISFRKSCQYVPNELLLNQTISDWDAQGIIFKGIFHTHKEGHGCQCLSSADIVYIRSIMNAYVKKLYFPIVIPHTGVFPYLAVYDQLSGLSITPEELNLTL